MASSSGPGGKRPSSKPRPLHDEFDDEDKTPVTSDPFVSLEHRSKRTHEDTKAALQAIQLVAEKVQRFDEKVDSLDQKLDEYIKLDQREHASLRETSHRNTGALRTISGQISQLDKTSAVGTKTMELILEDVRSLKRVEEHRTKVTIETDAIVTRAETQNAADSAKFRRKRSLKILGIIGSVLGSGGIAATIIAAAMGKC